MDEKKKISILELNPNPWPDRWVALQNFLKDRHGLELKVETRIWGMGMEMEFSSLDTALRNQLVSELNAAMTEKFDAITIETVCSRPIVSCLPRQTQNVALTGAFDSVVLEKGHWWPRSFFEEGFTSAISKYIGILDLDSSALVVGTDGAAFMAIASLVKLGFGTINIADMIVERAEDAVLELRKRYFQVNFACIPYQAITRLPGVHSIVVNASPLSLENELLDELYFFNFLKSGGVVIDLTLVPSNTPLLQEAKQWGAGHLSGDFVYAERDALMTEYFTGKKIVAGDYRIQLRHLVDAAPFDAGPFLKRFRDREA